MSIIKYLTLGTTLAVGLAVGITQYSNSTNTDGVSNDGGTSKIARSPWIKGKFRNTSYTLPPTFEPPFRLARIYDVDSDGIVVFR